MHRIVDDLLREKRKYQNMLQKAGKRLQKAPEGSVRMAKHGSGYQFYFRAHPTDSNGVYMPVSQQQKAHALVQKRYDQRIVKAAETQMRAIEHFLKQYDPDAIKNLYCSLPEERKKIIDPVELPNEEYTQAWKSAAYIQKEFTEDVPEQYTSSGERVRSKSEVLIADALKQAGVPYKYECPLVLGHQTIHPDFTILRMSDRQEIYWEHLGRMDEEGYCRKALRRIRLYEMNGIYPGIRLILTMETSDQPVNLSVIRKTIKTYCC